MSTAKVSVAIGEDELAWARLVARREGKSLSAVVTESLAERKRLAAMREVLEWMGEGEPPLTRGEIEAAKKKLGVDETAGRAGRRKAGRSRRR
jgi:hypothetical protein